MGPFILPALLVVIVVSIIASWLALARYDRAHPPSEDVDEDAEV